MGTQGSVHTGGESVSEGGALLCPGATGTGSEGGGLKHGAGRHEVLAVPESRTSTTASARSRQRTVHTAKQNRPWQPGWLPGGRDALVPEKLVQVRADASGRETAYDVCTCVTGQPCLQSGATRREAPAEIPHSPSGVPRHLPKRPRRAESITFQYN
ncbi:hypothetical protein HJG60_011074 [Phyllostomus discolor]|uniref:Uncharacterized protein n=1 Tax=Phyllostomus discolor TaxID=89673 RepID=A0A834AE41_9CHIR|nr:hypothetical protein HJG60_011074 [Phyllostomus discolor]